MNKHNRFSPIVYFLLKLKSLKTSSNSGYVLVIAIATIVALTGLLAVYGRSNRINNIATSTTLDSSGGFFAAEAALNQRAEKLRKLFLDRQTPSGNSPQDLDDCITGSGSQLGSGDLACEIITLSASATNRTPYIGTTYVVEGQRIEGIVPRGDRFQNLSMSESMFSIYALGLRENAEASQASAILQMDVRAREIPMFQFAAFYKDDLEILPGPTMNLNGPIHTDGSLYLGGNNNNGLNINGQVTVAGQLFSKRKNDNSTYPNGRVRIRDAADSNWISLILAGTGSTSATTNAMDPIKIATAFGTQVQVGVDSVSIPTPDILDGTGEYFQKANIRINYTPTGSNVANYENNVPFTIQVINRTDSNGNLISNPSPVSLTEAQRRSLRQPILVSPELASIPESGENFIAINDANRGSADFTVAQNPNYNICTAPYGYNVPSSGGDSGKIVPNSDFGTPAFQNMWKDLTWEQQRDVAEFAHDILVTRVQDRQAPLLFSSLNTMGGIPGLTFTSGSADIPASVDTSDVAKLNSLNPQQIASLPYRESDGGDIVQRCFIPAPLIDIGRDNGNHNTDFRFRNQREGRDMRILQLNMKSMVVWNFEGQYLNGSDLTPPGLNELLYKTAPADNSAPPNSFQSLGMAARDISDGGLVIHATININPDDTPNYPNAATNQSRYGFAIVEGDQLPGLGFANSFNNNDPTGLTFASDQAVYLQGNYNTRNKQPAAVLSDSLNVLSNRCLNNNRGINHRGNGANCAQNTQNNPPTLGNALETVINAAFLAGNDITTPSNYNGGLENYPRFLENWSGVALRYRGSFVSISTPLRVSGAQGGGFYSPPNREWDYDQSFNDPRNLPPLTPQFVYLKQDSFFRSFDQ